MQEKEKKKRPEWTKEPQIIEYVRFLKANYPSELGHIQPDNIIYVGFSKKRSSAQAWIQPIKGVTTLFRNEAYVLAVWIENWEIRSEAERSYIIMHELLHIPEYGFQEGTKEYKKLAKHDLEDWKILVDKFGAYKEKISMIIDNPDVKSISSETLLQEED